MKCHCFMKKKKKNGRRQMEQHFGWTEKPCACVLSLADGALWVKCSKNERR